MPGMPFKLTGRRRVVRQSIVHSPFVVDAAAAAETGQDPRRSRDPMVRSADPKRVDRGRP